MSVGKGGGGCTEEGTEAEGREIKGTMKTEGKSEKKCADGGAEEDEGMSAEGGTAVEKKGEKGLPKGPQRHEEGAGKELQRTQPGNFSAWFERARTRTVRFLS